jgi:hypothetical protein
VANYNVDIEVALRGARELKVLKDSLKGVNKEVGRLNAATIKAGKALRGTFSAKDIGNVNNYSKAVAKAERALRNAAFGTEAEKKAVKALVTAQKEFNEQLDRQNRLLKEEERLQGVNQPVPKAPRTPKAAKAPKAGFQSFGVSGIDFMPVGGSTSIPGSPLARQAKSRARFGSAVSAGAFPLLFGGGPGMALGGALGGAISGSTFGPAAIALQVLGGAFDQLAAQAASLGAALNPATADVDALVESLGLVGSPIQDSISSLEELAGQQVALQEATRQLSIVVGDKGVQALADLGDASTRFGNALTQVTTQILAQIAKLTGGIVGEVAKTVEVGALLTAAKASEDPRQKALQKRLAGVQIKPGERGISPERAQIEADMVKLQREIRAEEEGRLQAAVERARAGSAEHTIAKNNLAIAKLDDDLTNTRVFNLEKANIFQKARKKLLEEGADVKLIELERDGQLLELTNKRNALIETANKKADRERKKSEKERMKEMQDRIKIAEKQRAIELKKEESFNKQLDKIGDQNELLRARLNGNVEEVQQQQLINNLVEKYGEDKRKIIELTVEEQFGLKEQVKVAEQLKNTYAELGTTIKSGVVDAISAAVEGTKSLGEVAGNVLRNIANRLLDIGVNMALFGVPTGFGKKNSGGLLSNIFGERALGGSVSSGRPYMVGERGPELFVPGAQGNIVPNNAMSSTSVVVNVDASGTEVQGNQGNADQLGRLIGQAVQAELIKQKRPGGLLTR